MPLSQALEHPFIEEFKRPEDIILNEEPLKISLSDKKKISNKRL